MKTVTLTAEELKTILRSLDLDNWPPNDPMRKALRTKLGPDPERLHHD
jgi:hypothetical protein